MKEKENILQELADMKSPLTHIGQVMPYVVPNGYFENFASSILNNIKLAETPDPILGLSKEMPYSIPVDYFSSLQEQLNDCIKEIAETRLPKTIMPFNRPEEYFETLPLQILNKIKEEEQPAKTTKIISLGSEIWRQVRWASAAILILGIGLGSLKMFVQPQASDPELALSEVSKIEISNYVDQNIDDFDADMITDNLSVSDISILTNQLDDDDITQYLNENGWDHAE